MEAEQIVWADLEGGAARSARFLPWLNCMSTSYIAQERELFNVYIII
jgi:hypothetical protein